VQIGLWLPKRSPNVAIVERNPISGMMKTARNPNVETLRTAASDVV